MRQWSWMCVWVTVWVWLLAWVWVGIWVWVWVSMNVWVRLWAKVQLYEWVQGWVYEYECKYKAVSTSVHECETNVKCIMWLCRRTAITFIRLCGVCSVNRQTLSVWSRYFKEKYIPNHTDVDIHSFGQATNNQWNICTFARVANAEQATFWHSLAFVSVPHVLFAFAYRCGRALSFSPHK